MSLATAANRTSTIRKWAVIAGITLLVLICAGFVLNGTLSRLGRDRIMQSLRENFASDLELSNLSVTVFPRVSVEGEGIVLRYHGRRDLPPLISIHKFSATAGLPSILLGHVNRARVEGLEIQVPPRSEQKENKEKRKRPRVGSFVIDEVQADGTILKTLPKDSGKDPLVWEIRRLTLHNAGSNTAMSFRATLVNAKPPGDIESQGKFGPWDAEKPSETPVEGSYTFQHADLSVFPGISGILSSKGAYRGVLERIEANGETDTPDFALKVSGNRVHLTTKFQAVIDGTDGDTYLQPVTAHFGNSTVIARGSVEGKKGIKGKTVSLDAAVDGGRLEDMLRLATKGRQASMNGAVSFRTKIVVPPGDTDVSQKTQLNGRFTVASAHFAKLDVQEKVDELSHRGKGQPQASPDDTVASDFAGQFKLVSGVMTFRSLSFRVPGVRIALEGGYQLASESLNFHGTAELEAKLSQTTTGFKSFLLKALDPIFRKKDGKTVLPIHIAGTRDNPSFGLDMRPAHSAEPRPASMRQRETNRNVGAPAGF